MRLVSPIDMEVFENAVYDWFTTQTGLEAIWREQGSPQPPYPYGSLLITSGPRAASSLYEYREDTNLSREPGKEVRTVSCVPCQFTVSCQTYVKRSDSRNPKYNARNYMNRAQSSLSLPSVKAAFRKVNIAVSRFEEVQNINVVIEDAYVSRANLDVIFNATLSLEDYCGYIEKVQVKSSLWSEDLIVDASS